jgi:hypothetical protein
MNTPPHRRLLLGLHGEAEFTRIVSVFGERQHYLVMPAHDIDELARFTRESLDIRGTYPFAFMDANFGSPGLQDISSALKIYNLLKERLDAGTARYPAILGDRSIVRLCIDAGLPASPKPLPSLRDAFQD